MGLHLPVPNTYRCLFLRLFLCLCAYISKILLCSCEHVRMHTYPYTHTSECVCAGVGWGCVGLCGFERGVVSVWESECRYMYVYIYVCVCVCI